MTRKLPDLGSAWVSHRDVVKLEAADEEQLLDDVRERLRRLADNQGVEDRLTDERQMWDHHPREYAKGRTLGRTWDPTKYRRWPKGTPGGLGGKFRDKKSAAKLSKLTGIPAEDLLRDPSLAKKRRRGVPLPPLGERKSPMRIPADPNSPDAIDVHGDVNLAVKLLAEGKPVKLRQPREVSVLLDKLAEIVERAERDGNDAPQFDLCKVTVKGQNLFCAQSKGIPRQKMPQLGGIPKKGSPADKLPKNDKGGVDLTPQFIEHLNKKGYTSTDEKEHVAYLRATQNQLIGGKVAGMTKAAKEGKWDPLAEHLVISADNYILDGHHRWATGIGLDAQDNRLGNDKRIPVTRVKIGIIDLIREAHKFANEMGMPTVGFEG